MRDLKPLCFGSMTRKTPPNSLRTATFALQSSDTLVGGRSHQYVDNTRLLLPTVYPRPSFQRCLLALGISLHPTRVMSSDDAYSSFLNQANQDTSADKVSAESKKLTTKSVDTDIPVSLQKIEKYYTSESDEPFEPVSLHWTAGKLPSESEFVLLKNLDSKD